tara:strand:+ start:379 stop:693 length:315 start_codon:yes stop_codon:yes gene_type:complete
MAPKEELQEYRDKRRAKILDLIYYFGEDADDWIDLKRIAIDKVIDRWRGKVSTKYPPYLCLKCKRYWSYVLNIRKQKTITYLSRDIFGGIRCNKKNCKDCKDES